MDLGRVLRDHLQKALREAGSSGRQTNIVAAVNINGEGLSTSVYSDGEVTVVRRDGETQVFRNREEPPPDKAGQPPGDGGPAS